MVPCGVLETVGVAVTALFLFGVAFATWGGFWLDNTGLFILVFESFELPFCLNTVSAIYLEM